MALGLYLSKCKDDVDVGGPWTHRSTGAVIQGTSSADGARLLAGAQFDESTLNMDLVPQASAIQVGAEMLGTIS